MFAKPSVEHDFFTPLLGEWTMEHRCDMGPDQPQAVSRGRMTGRSLEGLWTLLEAAGEMPSGGIFYSVFTLGYDPTRKVYHGTFIGSVMTHLNAKAREMLERYADRLRAWTTIGQRRHTFGSLDKRRQA